MRCALAVRWTLNVENERKLERTETRMIRIMCGVTLRDRVTNVELKKNA
jgi:hypothetical protein